MSLSESPSFFDAIKAGSWEGYAVLIAAIASIILAVVKKYKLLLLTGIVILGVVVLNLINMKSSLAKGMGLSDAAALEGMGVEVSTNWLTWIMLIVGALVILAAGAMGKTAPAAGGNYGAPPPPYPPAR
jgi:hypothetical protein